jgi:DNA-binding CsgD family transcriptional regulator
MCFKQKNTEKATREGYSKQALTRVKKDGGKYEQEMVGITIKSILIFFFVRLTERVRVNHPAEYKIAQQINSKQYFEARTKRDYFSMVSNRVHAQTISNYYTLRARAVSYYSLSGREHEVAMLVLDGGSYKTISEELGVAEATIKQHVHNILRKTQTKNRQEFSYLISNMLLDLVP